MTETFLKTKAEQEEEFPQFFNMRRKAPTIQPAPYPFAINTSLPPYAAGEPAGEPPGEPPEFTLSELGNRKLRLT